MEVEPHRDAIDEIIFDLSDRGGIGAEWDQIDEDTQEEIKQAWREILQNEKDPEKAVNLILADLTDRRGLKKEWDHIDEDIKAETRQAWIELIRIELIRHEYTRVNFEYFLDQESTQNFPICNSFPKILDHLSFQLRIDHNPLFSIITGEVIKNTLLTPGQIKCTSSFRSAPKRQIHKQPPESVRAHRFISNYWLQQAIFK